MITTIESLPLLRVSIGVGTDEDLAFTLPPFMASDGVTPLALTGITFTLSIGALAVLTSASGALTVSGSASNVLSVFQAAAGKTAWLAGVYPMSLLAADGTFTRDLFTQSWVTHAPDGAAPLYVAKVAGSSGVLAASVSAQTALNTAAIATLQQQSGSSPPVVLTGSNTIVVGGMYLVATVGSTQVLPSPSAWTGGDIIIKDWTGSSTPSITISGTIDRDPTGAFMNASDECFWLRACPTQNSWAII